MKSIRLAVLILLLLTASLTAQTVIENPEKPPTNNAGRILRLEELMQITDESGDFFFRRPHSLSLDKNSCIYFADEDLFLKFSPEGNFIKNLYKQGQGPGEIQKYFSYVIQDETILVWDSRSRKIIFYDLNGQLIRELKLRNLGGMRMIGPYKNSIIFSTFGLPDQDQMKGKIIDMEHDLHLVSMNSGEINKITTVAIPWFFGPGYGMAQAPFNVLASESGDLLLINDSPEYRIKVMDTSTGKIPKIFSRKYKRIKAPKRPAGIQSRSAVKLPERKYAYDIRYMFWNQTQIWISTSTQDEKKGSLYDVFSLEGNYLDCFYLPKEVSLMKVYGDILFARRQDEDGNYAVVKYKILDGTLITNK
ncbi:MAG: 6-bladed beta-propeller [Candidatus Aminicenantes bacterium]|nr:6-bladed beta-propeller [Candidatus Aminicenantes bacterium]